MQKQKDYVETKFTAEILSHAIGVLKVLAEESKVEIYSEQYRVEHDDSEWRYDELNAFLGDYRKFNNNAHITIGGLEVSLSIYIRLRETTVSVEAPTRSGIEKVFGVFEDNLINSALDAQEIIESKPLMETRNIRIAQKILTLKNVRSIALVIINSCEKLPPLNGWDIEFTADCVDATFESSDIDLFDEEKSILSKKTVRKITLNASNYVTRSRIDIQLSHGNSNYSNSVSIRGTDSNWVNGTLKAIEETFESFQPQNGFIKTHRAKLEAIAAISIGILFFEVLFYIILSSTSPSSDTEPSKFIELLKVIPLGVYLFKYFLAYLVGMLPAYSLLKKLEELWPSIELQLGPEHALVEKRRRLLLLNFVVLGVLPLLVSVVYDLLKWIGA